MFIEVDFRGSENIYLCLCIKIDFRGRGNLDLDMGV